MQSINALEQSGNNEWYQISLRCVANQELIRAETKQQIYMLELQKRFAGLPGV